MIKIDFKTNQLTNNNMSFKNNVNIQTKSDNSKNSSYIAPFDEKKFVNFWSGIFGLIFGLCGLLLPHVEGNNKEATKQFLTRNVPLGVVGFILGGIGGTIFGQRAVNDNKQGIDNFNKFVNSNKNS
jgi:H+/Cl- antiporter ClcA